jgi:hypothetical protein
VRLRFEQHCFIVVSNIDVAYPVGRRTNRSSVGILRDWQPWG